MFGPFFALVIGIIIGAIGMFFVARNNREEFLEVLSIDFEQKAKALLNKTEVDDEVKKFIADLRTKFKK
jgi:hypothetical protein